MLAQATCTSGWLRMAATMRFEELRLPPVIVFEEAEERFFNSLEKQVEASYRAVVSGVIDYRDARIPDAGGMLRWERIVGIVVVEFADPVLKSLLQETVQRARQKSVPPVRRKINAADSHPPIFTRRARSAVTYDGQRTPKRFHLNAKT